MKNKIRKITYSISLVLLIALMGLTLAACDEELGEVRFTYNGQQVERIDTEIGGEPFQIGVEVDTQKSSVRKNVDIAWSIEGEALGASITKDGIFTPGEQAGEVLVKVEASYKKESKSANIYVGIHERQLNRLEFSGEFRTEYIEGDKFDPQGLIVTAIYGYSQQSIESYDFDDSPFDADDTSVEVTYTENGKTVSGTIAVTVQPRTLQRIEISGQPNKTHYIEGQTFDPSGMAVTAVYEFKRLEVGDFRVVTDEPLALGATAVVISYTESGVTKTAEVAVTVEKNYLASIEIAYPAAKTAYNSGELLNTVGLVVNANYTNGTKKIVTGWTVDRTDPLTVSDTTVTVTYAEGDRGTKTVTYPITVTERTLERLSVTHEPHKKDYIEGEVFLADGLEVTAHYSGGTSQVVSDYAVSVANRPLTLTDDVVEISYTENGITVDVSVAITVEARVLTGLEIVARPDKTAYKVAERFEDKGLIVRAIYNDGRYAKLVANFSVDIKGRALTEQDSAATVSYTENSITKTAAIAITVSPRTLVGIEITNGPKKTVYDEGEFFDVLGMRVTAHYADSADAEAIGWTFDKTEALKVGDTTVTVTYTEAGVTKTATLTITVNAVVKVDSAAAEAIAVIAALPSAEALTLENESAVAYAQEIYNALSSEQQAQVSNHAKLTACAERIAILKAEQPPVVETQYAITYEASGYAPADFDCGGNPAVYKNSEGAIALKAPVSAEAVAAGYRFVRWVDKATGRPVTEIAALEKDVTFQAIYELTETADIIVMDMIDSSKELARLNAVRRMNEDGSYLFDLAACGVAETIFAATNKMVLSYYTKGSDGKFVWSDNSTVMLDHGAEITVYAFIVATRQVSVEPISDGTISWTFVFEDDVDDRTIHRSYTAEENLFDVPIGAQVIVYAQNPLITDILIDGAKAGLLYPSRQHTFTLSDGDTVHITFEYYVADPIVIEFKGMNSRTYSFDRNKWNGKLPEEALREIAFIFSEDNDRYLNRYEIGDAVLYYADLRDFVFEQDTQVNVVQGTNRFSLTLNYSGGQFYAGNLVGKQTIAEALNAGASASRKQLYEGIFGLELYLDAERQILFDPATLQTAILRENIVLYAAERTAFTVTADSANGSAPQQYAVPAGSAERFKLYEKLPVPQKSNCVFMGWALTDGGENVSNQYIDVVVVNGNVDTTLYAVWQVIPADQAEVTVVSGRYSRTAAMHSVNAMIRDIVDTDAYSVYIGRTLLAPETPLASLVVEGRVTLTVYEKALSEDPIGFAELDTRGGITDEGLPSFVALSTVASGAHFGYELSEFSPRKDGAVFIGWYTAAEGGTKVSAFSDLNRAENTVLYARYAAEGATDYSGEAFVGDWQTTYNGDYGLIAAQLILSADGTYRYETFVNGALSARMTGIYAYENGALAILTLDSDAAMLRPADLMIDIRFCGDNIVVANMIVAGASSVDTYPHMLTKGAVKAANYIGNPLTGNYAMTIFNEVGGVLTEQRSEIRLLANGAAEIALTVVVNGETQANIAESGYFRLAENGRIWLITNGSFGVADITETLALYVKEGQDYASLQAVGSLTAADNGSWSFAEVLEISSDGKLVLRKGGDSYGAYLRVKSAYEYFAVVQIGDKQYALTLIYDAATNAVEMTAEDTVSGAILNLRYNNLS